MSSSDNQAIESKIAIHVQNIITLKKIIIADQSSKVVADLQERLVSKISFIDRVGVDYFKTRYFTFLRQQKGDSGFKTLDIVVQVAEELEGLSNPTEEVLKLVRRIREGAAEISPRIAFLALSTASATSTASSPNTLKRKRVEDTATSQELEDKLYAVRKEVEDTATSQQLQDRLYAVRIELAGTKELLRISEERFKHVNELLSHSLKTLRSTEELLQDRSTAYDLMEEYNSVLHRELVITNYNLTSKRTLLKGLTHYLIQELEKL